MNAQTGFKRDRIKNYVVMPGAEPKIRNVWFDLQNLYVVLESGHTVGCPLAWFPRLQQATDVQREQFETGPHQDSIHWENLDEDISLESLFDFKKELNYSRI